MKSACCGKTSAIALAAIMLAALWIVPAGGQNAADAKTILKQIGVTRGICLVLNDPQGSLAVDLAKSSDLIVYLQLGNAGDVAAARQAAEKAGLLGVRVYVEQGKNDRLHLADNLADAVVAVNADGASKTEVLRVLRPDGKALLAGTQVVKPYAAKTDDWSHPYHGPDNNPQSKDQVARGPFLTHFMAEPYYAAMPQVSVISGGRIFKACGNRTSAQPQWPMHNQLICVNAFNGTLLWKHELKAGWMLHRCAMIATPTALYFADETSCKVFDAETGKIIAEITVPADLADGPVWKWMALENGILYALVGENEPAEPVVRTGAFRGAGWPWWGIPNYLYGFGRTILAIDPASKKVLWHHREQDKLDGRAMCMSHGKIYFYSNQKFLGALDAKSGKLLWKNSDADLLKAIGDHKPAQNPGEGFASTSYVKCSEKVLFFAGPTRPNLVGASAENGKLLWQHPDGNHQLVLRDDGLYALGRGRAMVGEGSMKLNPVTGEVLTRFPSRDRCTRATGCFDAIFTRGGKGGSTAVFDVLTEKPTVKTLTPMRPACQDGVLVAHGHLFWGPWMCRCDLTQIGLISLEPAGQVDFTARASDADRLQATAADPSKTAALAVTADDWPTYRHDNARSCQSSRATPTDVKKLWEFTPSVRSTATAQVAAGGLVFVSGSDGIIRAVNAADGTLRWTAHTGGPVSYPPSISNNRLYAGSGDGWVYCLEAATGKQLWRFRAAPTERTIPIFGSLTSTWAVGSGVLVEDGVAYAAAGTFNYNGTHVYALDAATGKIRWHNNTSGTDNASTIGSGAGVQGHLLLNKQTLCLAGGNSAAVMGYDAATGKHAPAGSGNGGKDLFLVGGQVRSSGFPLYWRPEDSHLIALAEFSTPAGTVLVSTAPPSTQVALATPDGGKGKQVWTVQPFSENAGIAITKNAVIVAGVDRKQNKDEKWEVTSGIVALNLADGKQLWRQPLPGLPVSFGVAVDRDGRILVSLQDGRVICLGPSQ
jgi:outer membrane protein assembly factor BamB